MSQKLKIAFQGEPGANSHIAIVEAYPDAEPIPCATFEDALAAISSGEADLGMIPIENSNTSPTLSMTINRTSWTSTVGKYIQSPTPLN